MLKINKFYWDLYRMSPEGKYAISLFSHEASSSIEDELTLLNEYDPELFLNYDKEDLANILHLCEDLEDNNKHNWGSEDVDSLREQYKQLIETAFDNDYEEAIRLISGLSFYLYKQNQDFFIPYMFLLRYKYLRQILEDYDMNLLEVPGKASHEKRCMYYFEICRALYEFRKLNGLTSAELCAFIYDMERKRYDAEILTEATAFPKVWMISGTKKNEREANDKLLFWHAI